jgi:hypothetical protein
MKGLQGSVKRSISHFDLLGFLAYELRSEPILGRLHQWGPLKWSALVGQVVSKKVCTARSIDSIELTHWRFCVEEGG